MRFDTTSIYKSNDKDNPTANLECRCAEEFNTQNVMDEPISTEVSDTTLLLWGKSVPSIPKVSVKIKSKEYLEHEVFNRDTK